MATGKKSTNLGNFLLVAILVNPSPDPCQLALYVGDPENGGAEHSGTGYSRKDLSFNTQANKNTTNDTAVTWASLPAGTITHWAIHAQNNSLLGNGLLYYGAFDVPLVINATDPLTIAIGDINITEV